LWDVSKYTLQNGYTYAIHNLVTLAQNGPGNLDRGWKYR
jgi:hypothetical protein